MKYNTSSPAISILMPVKNAEMYLDACLQSILKQSYTEWELEAVDDHSTDRSGDILEKYALTDPRIRIHRSTGLGIIAALRTAYHHARGMYITRMDADDLMSSDKLFVLLNLLKAGSSALPTHKHLAVGSVSYFSNSELGAGYLQYAKWLNTLTISGNNFNDLYKECVIPSPCWMVMRSHLDECGAFSSEKYPEDYDLAFRFYRGGMNVLGTSKILHHWRDHPNRSSRNDPNYLDNRFLELKCYHFFEKEFDVEKKLCLWGAGQKGKALSQKLNSKGVNFQWITNNSKKIGHEIYGKKLIAEKEYKNWMDSNPNSQVQIIIAVANKMEQLQIKKWCDEKKLKSMKDFYFFC